VGGRWQDRRAVLSGVMRYESQISADTSGFVPLRFVPEQFVMMIMRLNNKVIPTGCSNGWYEVHLSFCVVECFTFIFYGNCITLPVF